MPIQAAIANCPPLEQPPVLIGASESIITRFPANTYVHRLISLACHLGIRFTASDVHEQWLYHPEYRTIYVWEPDLVDQSLSYLVVVLSHELGHALDFDASPELRRITRDLHWSDVPDSIERSAFVRGFLILQELGIPINLRAYTSMIQEPMATEVAREIESDRLCCLVSGPLSDWIPVADQPVAGQDVAPGDTSSQKEEEGQTAVPA